MPGHELAGVVEAVGPEVRGWAPGARVTVPFVCACGDCEQCAAGNEQVCDRQRQPGFTHWGSFAELVALDWADVNLVALPEAVGGRRGGRARLPLRHRLPRGRAGRPRAAGRVGRGARLRRRRAVGGDDRRGARRAGGRRRRGGRRAGGGARGGRGGGGAAGGDVRELTGGGAHVSLDAIGAEAACAASVAGLRKRGRHVQVGLLPEPPRVPMDLVIARELELLGSHGMAARAYPELLALVEAGTLRPGDLVTREIGLDEAPAALAAMGEAGPAGVTVIRP